MKVVIDSKKFVEAVGWATKNYDAKNDRAFVRLGFHPNGGVVSHTNLSSYLKSDLVLKSFELADGESEPSDIAVDGRYLQRLASAVSGTDDIVLTKDLLSAKTSLDVKTKYGKFTVPIITARIDAEPEPMVIGTVDDVEFFDSLTRISKLCDPANSGSNNFIGSVDLGFDTGSSQISLLATDKYALGEVRLPFSVDDETDNSSFLDEHILLPHASATLISPSKGLMSTISLIGEVDDNGNAVRFGYDFPDGRVALFSLLDAARFSNVDAMKKKTRESVDQEMTVSTQELSKALRIVSSLAWEADDIYFSIDGDGITVSDVTDSNTLAVSAQSTNYIGEDSYRVRFVRTVIDEALSIISYPFVSLRWSADATSGAFLLTPVDDDGKTVDSVFVMAVIGRM